MANKTKEKEKEIVKLKTIVFEEMGTLKSINQAEFECEMIKIMAGILKDKMSPALFIRNKAVNFLCKSGGANLGMCTKDEAIRIVDGAIKLITEKMDAEADKYESKKKDIIVNPELSKTIKGTIM